MTIITAHCFHSRLNHFFTILIFLLLLCGSMENVVAKKMYQEMPGWSYHRLAHLLCLEYLLIWMEHLIEVVSLPNTSCWQAYYQYHFTLMLPLHWSKMTACTPYHRFIWKSKRISFNINFRARIVSWSFTMMALTFQLPSSINT